MKWCRQILDGIIEMPNQTSSEIHFISRLASYMSQSVSFIVYVNLN